MASSVSSILRELFKELIASASLFSSIYSSASLIYELAYFSFTSFKYLVSWTFFAYLFHFFYSLVLAIYSFLSYIASASNLYISALYLMFFLVLPGISSAKDEAMA